MTYYIVAAALMLVSLLISLAVRWAYNRYSSDSTRYTGAQAAAIMLKNQDVTDVSFRQIAGSLTDNYSPTSKVLNLSSAVYNNANVSAVAVACHEAGHALQHATGYALLNLRKTLVPAVNISSTLSYFLIMIGLAMDKLGLVKLGAIVFSAIVLFNLVTLPVEVDASNRALKYIREYGLIDEDKMKGASIVLRAAGCTYFLSLLTSILTLMRYVSIGNSRRRD